MKYNYVAENPETTFEIGYKIGGMLKPGSIVTLSGDLGAGKTVMTKGIMAALGYSGNVTSPTYTLMNVYESDAFSVCHYDCYRLSCEEDLDDIGFWDYATSNVSVLEWAGNVFDVLPKNAINVLIKRKDEESPNKREICVDVPDEMGSL